MSQNLTPNSDTWLLPNVHKPVDGRNKVVVVGSVHAVVQVLGIHTSNSTSKTATKLEKLGTVLQVRTQIKQIRIQLSEVKKRIRIHANQDPGSSI